MELGAMSDDQDAVEHPRGRILSVPLHLIETYKQQKSTKKRSLFRRRNKKQSTTRRDLVKGSCNQVLSPRPGKLSESHIKTPLLDDFDDSEEDHDSIKWDAASAISDITGSQDEGGSLSSSQRSRSPLRLLNRTTPPTSIRSERSYQDCSSIDGSIFSHKGEELTTISEASAIKKQQSTRPSHSSSTSRSRKKSGRRSRTSLGLFGTDSSSVDNRSTTSENLNRAGSSETSSHRESASVGSCSDQRRRHRTTRKSAGALGSYLETPSESRERRTSRSVDSQSTGSRKDKGYIKSFLGSGKDDDYDDVQPEEAPSLVASTITSTTKSKQEEEMDNLDDQSHASRSTIISRGLNYLEKFYEECA
jgi:hypothetical protein